MPLVSSPVASDFCVPISNIRFDTARAIDASRAPMPEASVDKYTDAARRKYEVRFAWKLRCMQAVSKPSTMKKVAHHDFRARVLAPDLPHVGAATLDCQAIGHEPFTFPSGEDS